MNTEKIIWEVGDVFITTFWGNAEVCLIRKISEKYVWFVRLESIRDKETVKKDYWGASMLINLFDKVHKKFLHKSQWYYEYQKPTPSTIKTTTNEQRIHLE